MTNIFKAFNRCDLFVVIWSLYMLQAILYPLGIINRVLQLVLLLWGSLVVCRCVLNFTKQPRVLNATTLLLLMYIIYGLIHILFGSQVISKYGFSASSNYVYLQASLNSLLPIFVFYDFTKKGLLTEDRIKKYLFLFLIVFILLFVHNSLSLMQEDKQEENTNNIAYMFVTLVPLVYFYYKKPLLQYIVIFTLFVFVLLGVKRGAILIFLLSVVYFIFTQLKNRSNKKRVNILLTAMLLLLAISFVQNRLSISEYLNLRIEQTAEGSTSGRDILYKAIWNEVSQETNLLTFIFGRGANSTIGIAGNYAHNDWLETLCNNGAIGAVILGYFFLVLFKLLFVVKRNLPPYYLDSFFTLFLIVSMKSVFSMSIQNMEISTTMLLGYIVYKSLHEKQMCAS